jgi:hypothetical protein
MKYIYDQVYEAYNYFTSTIKYIELLYPKGAIRRQTFAATC